MKNLGIYAGSFDMPTTGHLWMIREGAKLFDELVVAVGIHPDKTYQFTTEERIEMLQLSAREFPNVKVTSFTGDYLVAYAHNIEATHILRGVRSVGDYEYESQMRNVNGDMISKSQWKDISTVFLMPPRELREVSSSLVKGLVGPYGWQQQVQGYLPAPVYAAVFKKTLQSKFMGSFLSKHSPTSSYICAVKTFGDLIIRYSESQRKYHTLQHISDCLDELDHYKSNHTLSQDDALFVATAIWFHDAVYDPKADDNEAQSAELFKRFATDMGWAQNAIDSVTAMILATKTHESFDLATQLLLDIDLSILGRDTNTFKKYDVDIRKEYDHVNGLLYSMGRKKFMRKFYEAKPLFKTDFFRKKYETQAKENLGSIL